MSYPKEYPEVNWDRPWMPKEDQSKKIEFKVRFPNGSEIAVSPSSRDDAALLLVGLAVAALVIVIW